MFCWGKGRWGIWMVGIKLFTFQFKDVRNNEKTFSEMPMSEEIFWVTHIQTIEILVLLVTLSPWLEFFLPMKRGFFLFIHKNNKKKIQII